MVKSAEEKQVKFYKSYSKFISKEKKKKELRFQKKTKTIEEKYAVIFKQLENDKNNLLLRATEKYQKKIYQLNQNLLSVNPYILKTALPQSSSSLETQKKEEEDETVSSISEHEDKETDDDTYVDNENEETETDDDNLYDEESDITNENISKELDLTTTQEDEGEECLQEVEEENQQKNFEILEYSKKSFAIFGDIYLNRHVLNELNGLFNPKLTHPITGIKPTKGYIFKNENYDNVISFLKKNNYY